MRAIRLRLEPLEPRTLLSATAYPLPIQFDPLPNLLPAVAPWASDDAGSAAATAQGAPSAAAATKLPLSSVPALSSLPGAKVSLYLDFDGDSRARWGGYRSISTAAFTQDSDPRTFTGAELAAIRKIWQSVAEDYAPFRVNVTTVRPRNTSAGYTVQAIIGGAGAWTGGSYGGLAYVGSFTAGPNAVYVFSDNLANGYVRYTADVITHESGHSFGLLHQSQYSGSTKTLEYAQGTRDGRAPLMGNCYSGSRSLWWNGPSSESAASRQDDMAELAAVLRYRADDFGNDSAHATPLSVSGNKLRGGGVVATPSDADYFTFRTGAGTISLSVQAAAVGANLDAKLQLRDATGRVVASADPSGSLGAAITVRVAAGRYRLVVSSHGGYGDVGQYTVSGAIVAPTVVLPVPGGLKAAAVASTRIDLAWNDVAGATGYAIERSRDGAAWAEIATVGANVTRYANTALAGATTYRYRVRALFRLDSSEPSAIVSATTPTPPPPPTAPASVRAVAVSASQVDLRWDQRARHASAFLVERSGDGGRTWRTLARPQGGANAYADHTVAAAHSYQYRVRALNETGASPARLAFARTPAAPAAHLSAATIPIAAQAPQPAGPDATAWNAPAKVDWLWSDLSWVDSLGQRRA